MTSILPTSAFPQAFNRILAFEREQFGEDYVFYARQMLEWHAQGNFFYLHIPHPAFGKDETLPQAQSILAGISAIVVQKSSLEALLAGKIRANEMQGWQPEAGEPILYLNTLLTLQTAFVPALVKALFRELRAFTRQNTRFASTFVIPVNPVIERHLLRLGLKTLGSYRRRYAVLGASRDEIPWLGRL